MLLPLNVRGVTLTILDPKLVSWRFSLDLDAIPLGLPRGLALGLAFGLKFGAAGNAGFGRPVG